MWRAIMSFLGGPAARIGQQITEALSQKRDAETEQARIAADERIQQLNAQRDVLIAEQGWWVTRWIRPLLAYPVIIHFGAVVADSLFHFTWDVAALPAPMDEWEGWIVGAYFLTRPIEKVGTALVRERTRRRRLFKDE